MKSYSLHDLQALAKAHGFIRDNFEKVIRLNDILSFLSFQCQRLRQVNLC